MGLLVLAYMSGGPMPKTLAMAALGLLLGTIGIDQMSGYFRFSYGVTSSPTASAWCRWRSGCSASPRSCCAAAARPPASSDRASPS